MPADKESEVAAYQMPNLDLPNPPEGFSYPEALEFRNEQILVVNGFSLTEPDLMRVLENQHGILRAAAAHVLGARAVRAAVPALAQLLADDDDLVAVEAAHALARMGVPAGNEALLKCLERSIQAYLCPPIAAGFLAQLGDPAGYAVIDRALSADLSGTRVLACKQLFFFARFDGAVLADGRRIDVFALFDRALRDEDANVQWQALVQLRDLRAPASRPALEAFVGRSSDESLLRTARDTLAELPQAEP
jgi:HEAT repeat protein